ncbi:MAG TPA: hypothetical protein VJJ24_01775 [Candidatus Paceibacterota bacterium]
MDNSKSKDGLSGSGSEEVGPFNMESDFEIRRLIAAYKAEVGNCQYCNAASLSGCLYCHTGKLVAETYQKTASKPDGLKHWNEFLWDSAI